MLEKVTFLVALITTQSLSHLISSDRNAELYLILLMVWLCIAGPLVSDARKTAATMVYVAVYGGPLRQ